MNYGNILTSTWKTIWKDKAIIGFGMLMVIAPALIGLVIGGAMTFSSVEQLENFVESDFSNLAILIFFLVYFTFIAGSIFLSALSFAGTMKGALMAQERTAPLTFSELWEASLPYFWRMLGVMFSVGFLLMLIYMVPMILMVLVGALTAGIGFLCVFPLLIFLIPLGIVGYLMLSLSMAALVAEDGNVVETLQRAWNVMKSKFWPLVLMTVILYFIQMGIGMIIAIPMNMLQFAFIIPMQNGNTDPDAIFRYLGIFFAIFMPLTALMQGFALTYVNSAWMLSYKEITEAPAASAEEEDEIVVYDA